MYVIAGFVTVIITFLSIRLLRDIHPVLIGDSSTEAQGLQEFAGIDSLKMVLTLNLSVVTFSVLYITWLANRLRLQRLLDEAAKLKLQVMARLQG